MSDDLTLPDSLNTTNDPAAQSDHLGDMASSKDTVPALPYRHAKHELPPEADAAIHPEKHEHTMPTADSPTALEPTSQMLESDQIVASGAMLQQAAQQADADTVAPPPNHTKRTLTTTAASLVVLAGLSAAWMYFNPDTYSINNGGPAGVSQTSPTPTPNDQPAALGATNANQTLTLSFNNLPILAEGHYQAWINHDDQDVSIGRFKPNKDGVQTLDGQAFTPQVTYSDGDRLYITIEAGAESVSVPSKTVILSGIINSQGQTNLTFQAIDLSQAAGNYILATPTADDTNTKSGLWFAKPDGKTLAGPSLTIPDAPEGWKYEGQVVYKGVAVAIGRFSKANEADSFSLFTPNPDRTPSYPGQDFLQKAPSQLEVDFPTDLATGDWQVILSLEPDLDGQDPTGDSTFSIQPLLATIAQGAETYKEYRLNLNLNSLPSATISLDK